MIAPLYDDFMRKAIALAENGRWQVAPNPVVGAVLVKDGQIAARGWHTLFGGDHAEIACLKDAARNGINPAEHTLVVTLEPCNHQGKTPPCTAAILEAGIKHVVIGLPDVNQKAAGGADYLRSCGVQVEMGILETECRDLIADFIVWQTTSRPFVILKMASTADGRIATRLGAPQVISAVGSRGTVMELRSGIGRAGGAVLIGANTFMIDDPLLTARTETAARQPLAAVATSRLPSPDLSRRLLLERPHDCVFFSSVAQAASSTAQALRGKGARVYGIAQALAGPGLDLKQILTCLREKENCLYVLCEGGSRLGLSLLEDGVTDEFILHIAPLILGDEEAKPMFAGIARENMNEALRLRLAKTQIVDGDCHLHFRPAI